MRNWRWRGSTGAFRASVSALLLGLSLAQSVSPNNDCPEVLAPQSLWQPQYQDSADEESTVGFMAALVQSFLHTVQPNPFPQGQFYQFYPLIKHLKTSCLLSTQFDDIYHIVLDLGHRETPLALTLCPQQISQRGQR